MDCRQVDAPHEPRVTDSGCLHLVARLDDSVDPLTPAVGARTFPRNSRDLAQRYGNSDNDTSHVAVVNYIWELPFGRGKNHLSHGVVGKIMEGFELDGIFTAQTGHPS